MSLSFEGAIRIKSGLQNEMQEIFHEGLQKVFPHRL
tara:strand:+ start:14334 stop:14441 length:108 start_codon:yes stop_codon:yes gene_type:complete